MTAETFTHSGAIEDLPYKVSNKMLLWFMAIVPVCTALTVLDHFFFGNIMREAMNLHMLDIINITAILTFPHIIASLISFGDREYREYYRKPLIGGICVSLSLAIGSDIIFGGRAILVVVAFYSIYHNIMQQFGLSAIMLRQKPTPIYNLMKWTMVIPTWLAYGILSFPFIPELANHQEIFMQLVGGCLVVATALAGLFYYRISQKHTVPPLGLAYFLSNIALMFISYGMIVYGYGGMAILVGRVLHDLSAYWVYMVHDQNRNNTTMHNPVYKLPQKYGIKPLYVLMPLAVIVSSFLLVLEEFVDVMAIIISAFNMMHYYIESYIWKRGTPHRQYVPFV